MKQLYISIFVFTIAVNCYATRPTVNASNLSVDQVSCKGLQLKWTNGDGDARLIVASEGSASSWNPNDYTSYSANSNFGKGTDIDGKGSYIVYNATGTNFLHIDSLKPGKTYYFTIYEHDNTGASTLYLTNNAPTVSATAYISLIDFAIEAIDSCEAHNSFKFINKSTSTIPGNTYIYDFGDGKFSTLDTIIHQYKNTNGKIIVKLNATQVMGCMSEQLHLIRIYPKKVAYIDFTKFEDTQCLIGNRFIIDPQPIISPLPKSFTYKWVFDDGDSSTFKKMNKSYSNSGEYNVSVEILTYVSMHLTGCKDTITFPLVVLPEQTTQYAISDNNLCLKNNLFKFTNDDSSALSYQWNFGDGQFSSKRNAQHSYLNAGTYYSSCTVASNFNCVRRDTFALQVLSAGSLFGGLDSAYCAYSNEVKLTPAVDGGIFKGYPVTNNVLTTNTPGTYTLTYFNTLTNCKDSTSFKFRIRPIPTLYLGRDTLINSNQNITLDAGIWNSYLWSNSTTGRTIIINGQSASKGTTTYSVEVTNGEGCIGSDKINVSIDYLTALLAMNKASASIYPNPVINQLTIINNAYTEFTWNIFNMEGKCILSGDQYIQTTDLSDQNAGIYLLVVKDFSGSHAMKFIKE